MKTKTRVNYKAMMRELPETIYYSLKLKRFYPINSDGASIDIYTIIQPDLKKYKLRGDNGVFIIYDLKKQKHENR